MKTHRWGTFSVSDHLRDLAFVSDVLLYDKLAIPVPDGQEEWKRWEKKGRDPAKQQGLLKLLKDRAFPLPWTLDRHERWATEYYGDAVIKEERLAGGTARGRVVEALADDLKHVAEQRQNVQEDPDSAAQYITRMVLATGEDWEANVAQIAALAGEDVHIQPFPAYGSRAHFEESQGYVLRPDVVPGARPLLVFEAQFFVPDGPLEAHEELLACAVELSRREEITAWRNGFHDWRTGVMERGLSPEAAKQELEEKREAHAEAVRAAVGKDFSTRLAWAVGIFAAGAAAVGAAAAIAAMPAVAAGASLASAIAGCVTAVKPKQQNVPVDPESVGAFLHEVRSVLRR